MLLAGNYARVVQAWPRTADELVAAQHAVAVASPPRWHPGDCATPSVAAAWVCFQRGASGVGAPGDPAWAAAVITRGRRVTEHAVLVGSATGAYVPGLLALRIGPLLCEVICRLPGRPDVLLIDATGRDHPRRAGLAVQLGAVLDLPTVGITHRPLLATGAWPDDSVDACAPLLLGTLGTAVAVAFARNPMTVATIANDLQSFSSGRFVLGLGSQIKAHVQRRFSMPWSEPAARMREFVLALRAIWSSWQHGSRLDFRGDFYQHTLKGHHLRTALPRLGSIDVPAAQRRPIPHLHRRIPAGPRRTRRLDLHSVEHSVRPGRAVGGLATSRLVQLLRSQQRNRLRRRPE
jgi:deoxyribonuclease V